MPWAASSALLAVTQDFPACSAASTAASAVPPAPPINSTKRSISGGLREFHRIVEPFETGEIDAALFGRVPRGDAGDDDFPPRAVGQNLRLTVEKPDGGDAHRTKASKSDAQGRRHDGGTRKRDGPRRL